MRLFTKNQNRMKEFIEYLKNQKRIGIENGALITDIELLTHIIKEAEKQALNIPIVSGSFSHKHMENFAAKCMMLGHGGKTPKELLKIFCDNDL